MNARALFVCISVTLLMLACEVQASDMDKRFSVLLSQDDARSLDIQSAMQLALPVLWQRVVPKSELEKAKSLKARTSLVLQFKSLRNGMNIVFNPSQVRSFLAKHQISMISELPQWNLSIAVMGFSSLDEQLSRDLLDYSHDISDEQGFDLSPRGKKLQLIFTPAMDAYGEAMIQVGVQGAFDASLLSEVAVPAQGYTSYQLQGFLNQTLYDIRDAYSKDVMVFDDAVKQVLLTVDGEHPLSTQVLLEQAMKSHPAVLDMVPTLLQKERRQYRLYLRDGDDSWITSWFAAYGLVASQQQAGNHVGWLVESR